MAYDRAVVLHFLLSMGPSVMINQLLNRYLQILHRFVRFDPLFIPEHQRPDRYYTFQYEFFQNTINVFEKFKAFGVILHDIIIFIQHASSDEIKCKFDHQFSDIKNFISFRVFPYDIFKMNETIAKFGQAFI